MVSTLSPWLSRATVLAICASMPSNGYVSRWLGEMRAASIYMAPYTLPDAEQLSEAGISPHSRARVDAFRGANMRSLSWCRRHDLEVGCRLTAADWDGTRPVSNAGKHWLAGGYILGWDDIQPLSDAHQTYEHTDYATTTVAVRDAQPRQADELPPTLPPTIRRGDRGATVVRWQLLLLAQDYDLGPLRMHVMEIGDGMPVVDERVGGRVVGIVEVPVLDVQPAVTDEPWSRRQAFTSVRRERQLLAQALLRETIADVAVVVAAAKQNAAIAIQVLCECTAYDWVRSKDLVDRLASLLPRRVARHEEVARHHHRFTAVLRQHALKVIAELGGAETREMQIPDNGAWQLHCG